MKEKLTTKQKIVLGLMVLFVAFGIFTSLVTIKIGSYYIVPATLNILIYIVMAFYALVAYSKPHSNFLKYVLMLYALSVLFFALQSVNNSFVFSLLMGINALLVAYMSGRLVKLRKNKIVIGIVIVIFVIDIVITETTPAFIDTINSLDTAFDKFIYAALPFSKLIQFVPLAYSYVVRYHQHINAGIKFDEEKGAK